MDYLILVQLVDSTGPSVQMYASQFATLSGFAGVIIGGLVVYGLIRALT